MSTNIQLQMGFYQDNDEKTTLSIFYQKHLITQDIIQSLLYFVKLDFSLFPFKFGFFGCCFPH